MLKSIASARKHIHLETYIFADDALGRLVADALISKSKEGVEVRLIYDDVGCWRVPRSLFERMRRAGVDVNAFMPVKFPAFTSKVNYRNHRKVCIVDGVEAFVGGMNIALRYVKGLYGGQLPWRDTHVRIRGGAVYALQRTFLVDWYFVDRTLVTNSKYYPPMPWRIENSCLMQVVTSSPIAKWRTSCRVMCAYCLRRRTMYTWSRHISCLLSRCSSPCARQHLRRRRATDDSAS